MSSDKVALAVGAGEVALRNGTTDPVGAPWHPLRNQTSAQQTNLVPTKKWHSEIRLHDRVNISKQAAEQIPKTFLKAQVVQRNIRKGMSQPMARSEDRM